jgi:hypothetical protein
MNRLGVADQDCDGNADILLYNDVAVGTAHVSVLYGRNGQFPDTAEAETIDLVNANGHFSLFSDLTGDKVPELAVNCGSQETIKIYAGRSGQRLVQQYGGGNSPWAQVWLPAKIHDGWFPGGFTPFLELGDGDRDGYADLWLSSPPFILGYSGKGRYLDSLLDMAFRWGAVTSAASLGDIDGSGVASFAVGFGGSPGGIALYKGVDSASHLGVSRNLPHPVSERCDHSAGTEKDRDDRAGMPALKLAVMPNPIAGDIVVRWEGLQEGIPAAIIVADEAGQEIYHQNVPASTSEIILPADLAAGIYIVMLRSGNQMASTKIIIR